MFAILPDISRILWRLPWRLGGWPSFPVAKLSWGGGKRLRKEEAEEECSEGEGEADEKEKGEP